MIGIYFIIVFLVLLVTALMSLESMQPKEITCFYTWLFYGLLFPIPLFKGLFKFIYNIIKL